MTTDNADAMSIVITQICYVVFFEDEQSALNHLLDAVPEHNVEIIKQEKTKVVVKSGETITVRRVAPVEVNTVNKGIWCTSILEDKEDEICNWIS